MATQYHAKGVRMLARMPVARQLLLGFGLISLITLLEAAVVWFSVSGMDNSLRYASDRLFPQVERIGQLEVTIVRASLETRHAMLMRTPQEREATLAEIDRLVQRAEQLIADMERDLSTAEGKQRLDAVKRSKEGFLAAAGQIIPLIRAGQVDPAVDMLTNKVIPARNAFLGAIEHQREWQRELLLTSNAKALTTGARTEWLVLVVAVLTALLGIGLALAFSRHLARLLGGEPGDAVEAVQAIAAGNLVQQVPVRAGDTRSVMAALAAMQQGLTGLVASVHAEVDSVTSASGQIASGNADLALRTERQAASLQQIASTMAQITQSVRANSESARHAVEMAATASAAAEAGGEVVGKVVSTMGEIQGSSRQISDITGTIDSIAFQTNILALNAAVEAARAGEAGRGFAVVASEVRALAQRSAEASREIRSLIAASVSKIDDGDQLVKDAGQRMEEIVRQVHMVSQMLSDMSNNGDAQTRSIDMASAALAKIDQDTAQNTALVERSAAASESLQHNAEKLGVAVSAFRIS
ncbi:methyl-accepting chemotaxis protein [Acidovorax lacteus]|uniref:methyl-accepting chemotaxis protein n=1 Tax=Acidovorax lacteus TaxID=1924988 RepID=UPI0031ED9A78